MQQKKLALLSNKFDKHEHLVCEEILPSDQRRVIENAKFKYSPLRTKLEKQKTIADLDKKKKKKAIEDNNWPC